MASSALDLRTCAAAGKGLRVSAWIIAAIGLIVLWVAFDLGVHSNLILTGLFLVTGMLLLKPALGARNADLFHPACLFPAIYCFWFALGSLDILPPSLDFRLFEPIPLRMWGYYATGLAGYILAVGFKRKGMSRQHEQTSLSTTWDGRRFALAMGVLTLIGTAAYAYLVHKGGIPILSNDWAENRVEIGRDNGLVFTVFLCTLWIVIPMLFVFLWTKPRSKFYVVFTYSLASLLGLALFSMGSRGFVFVPVLIAIIVRHYLARRWKFARLALVGIVLFTLIGIAGYMRDYSEVTALADMGFPSWVQPLAPGYLYIRAPIATFRDISALISSQGNFQYGALFLSPFAVLAPGHHLSSDLFFKKVLGHNFLGFGEPASLLGVFYADFGIVGIFVGMFATGLLARWLYQRVHCGRSLLSVLLFSYYSYVLLFSLFGNLFPYLSTLWIPLVFVAVDRFALNVNCTARGQA
jgi:oligosaccharide repeat unit polymerase